MLLTCVGLTFSQTTAWAEQVILPTKNRINGIMNDGHHSFDKRDYLKASFCFSKAIEICPNNALAYACRGDCYSGLKNSVSAIADYNKALNLGTLGPVEDAFVYGLRGELKLKSGDLIGAKIDLDRSVQLDKNLYFVYLRRAQVRRAQADLIGSISDCDRALSMLKGDPDPRILLIRGLDKLRLGRTEEAGKDLLQVYRLDPNYIYASLFTSI